MTRLPAEAVSIVAAQEIVDHALAGWGRAPPGTLWENQSAAAQAAGAAVGSIYGLSPL